MSTFQMPPNVTITVSRDTSSLDEPRYWNGQRLINSAAGYRPRNSLDKYFSNGEGMGLITPLPPIHWGVSKDRKTVVADAYVPTSHAVDVNIKGGSWVRVELPRGLADGDDYVMWAVPHQPNYRLKITMPPSVNGTSGGLTPECTIIRHGVGAKNLGKACRGSKGRPTSLQDLMQAILNKAPILHPFWKQVEFLDDHADQAAYAPGGSVYLELLKGDTAAAMPQPDKTAAKRPREDETSEVANHVTHPKKQQLEKPAVAVSAPASPTDAELWAEMATALA